MQIQMDKLKNGTLDVLNKDGEDEKTGADRVEGIL